MNLKPSASLLTLAVVALSSNSSFGRGSVTYGGKKAAVAASFQNAMQCILNKLEQEKRYKPREVGCFGTRPYNASAHPTGHGCDVDQTARDVTKLNGSVPRADQIRIAQGCEGAVSGCKWRSPDCGHFEQRSAPYSPAGAGVGGHRYAGYENRPVRRRR